MTLYRPLKEGEIIKRGDMTVQSPNGLTILVALIGRKQGVDIDNQVFRPVKIPTFEEVFDSVDAECVYKRHECKYNNDCKLHIYKTTLKQMGFTGGE